MVKKEDFPEDDLIGPIGEAVKKMVRDKGTDQLYGIDRADTLDSIPAITPDSRRDDSLDLDEPERAWMDGTPAEIVYEEKESITNRVFGIIKEYTKKIPIKRIIYGTVLAVFVGGLYCLNIKEIDRAKTPQKIKKDSNFLEYVDSDLREMFSLEESCKGQEIEGAWNLELRVRNGGVKEFTITRNQPICEILANDIHDYFNGVWKENGQTGLKDGTYKAVITFKKP